MAEGRFDDEIVDPGSVFSSLRSQVVSLQTAHSWANAGVLLGDACIGSGVAFEAIKLLG